MSETTKMSGTAKRWETFEQAVTSIQRLISPNDDVQHNVKLPDIRGRLLQFDVVIRGEWAGRKVLGVIECRDKKRPVDRSQIDGFITKSRAVCANIAVMVSRAGFSKDAISLAKDHDIGTLSLLPDSNSDVGFAVGHQSFAEIYGWDSVNMTLYFKDNLGSSEIIEIDSILYEGRKIFDWFKDKLLKEHKKSMQTGLTTYVLEFDVPRCMQVNGCIRTVAGIKFEALRKIYVKTKFIRISGQAFYDWQNNTWSLPSGGCITTSMIRTDLSDWSDFDGEVPPQPEGEFSMSLKVFRKDFDPVSDFPDLESL